MSDLVWTPASLNDDVESAHMCTYFCVLDLEEGRVPPPPRQSPPPKRNWPPSIFHGSNMPSWPLWSWPMTRIIQLPLIWWPPSRLLSPKKGQKWWFWVLLFLQQNMHLKTTVMPSLRNPKAFHRLRNPTLYTYAIVDDQQSPASRRPPEIHTWGFIGMCRFFVAIVVVVLKGNSPSIRIGIPRSMSCHSRSVKYLHFSFLWKIGIHFILGCRWLFLISIFEWNFNFLFVFCNRGRFGNYPRYPYAHVCVDQSRIFTKKKQLNIFWIGISPHVFRSRSPFKPCVIPVVSVERLPEWSSEDVSIISPMNYSVRSCTIFSVQQNNSVYPPKLVFIQVLTRQTRTVLCSPKQPKHSRPFVPMPLPVFKSVSDRHGIRAVILSSNLIIEWKWFRDIMAPFAVCSSRFRVRRRGAGRHEGNYAR